MITPDTSADILKTLELSALNWMSVIKNDLQSTYIYKKNRTCGSEPNTILPFDYIVDDLLVFVKIAPVDGISGILGGAGGCVVTNQEMAVLVNGTVINNAYFVRVGMISLDVYDADRLNSQGRLLAVMMHELGHLLGIGSLWSMPFYHFTDEVPYYNGAGAKAGLALISPYPEHGPNGEPYVEQGAHWADKKYGIELMTGYLSGTNRLTPLTLGALQDFGFQVDMNSSLVSRSFATGAPTYTAGRRTQEEKEEDVLEMGDDRLNITLHVESSDKYI
jgi:hypothetical protein